MTSELEVIEKAIGPVIEIEENVSVWRMPSVFGRDYKRINEYLVANVAECVDMPAFRFHCGSCLPADRPSSGRYWVSSTVSSPHTWSKRLGSSTQWHTPVRRRFRPSEGQLMAGNRLLAVTNTSARSNAENDPKKTYRVLSRNRTLTRGRPRKRRIIYICITGSRFSGK